MLCPNCGREVGETAGLCQTCREMRSFFGPSISDKAAAILAAQRLEEERVNEGRAPETAGRRRVSETLFVLSLLTAVLLVAAFAIFHFLRGPDSVRSWKELQARITGGKVAPGPAATPAPPPFRNAVNGIAHGQSFSPERALFSRPRNTLTLRHGRLAAAELSIALELGGPPRAGQLIEVGAASAGAVPRAVLRWRDPQRLTMHTRVFETKADYSMQLRITAIKPDRVCGIISFTAADREGTQFSGIFEAAYE